MLTGEYLLDVTHVVSENQHEYSWLLHAIGQTEAGQTEQCGDSELPGNLYPLKDVRAYEAGEEPWSIRVIQTCVLEEPSKAKLPRQWYDRKIGVWISMLPGAARPPIQLRRRCLSLCSGTRSANDNIRRCPAKLVG